MLCAALELRLLLRYLSRLNDFFGVPMRKLLKPHSSLKSNARFAMRALGAVICLVVIGGLPAHTAQAQTPTSLPTSLPTTDLYVGMHRLKAELAIEPKHRATGLMWRKSMPDNHGMLFVFEGHAIHCFWMRNTFIPLSIAFLRDDGSVVNIKDMNPLEETSHCPAEPVRYALEVNQGWFDKRNVQPSTRIRGLPN